jgi:hypothetical protein
MRLLPITIVAIGACLAGTWNAADAQDGAASHFDPSKGELEYGYNERGHDVPLCNALMVEARKRFEAGQSQCTTPVPSSDARFGSIQWQALSAAENMDLVKLIFAWKVTSGNWIPQSQEMARELSFGPTVKTALVDEVWTKYRQNLPELIRSGVYRLERTEVRLVPGIEPIAVYRTTLLGAPDQSGQAGWRPQRCGSKDEQQGVWDVFYPLRESRWEEFTSLNSDTFGAGDLVLWADRAYHVGLFHPAGLYVSRYRAGSDSIFSMSSLCEIHIKWK